MKAKNFSRVFLRFDSESLEEEYQNFYLESNISHLKKFTFISFFFSFTILMMSSFIFKETSTILKGKNFLLMNKIQFSKSLNSCYDNVTMGKILFDIFYFQNFYDNYFLLNVSDEIPLNNFFKYLNFTLIQSTNDLKDNTKIASFLTQEAINLTDSSEYCLKNALNEKLINDQDNNRYLQGANNSCLLKFSYDLAYDISNLISNNEKIAINYSDNKNSIRKYFFGKGSIISAITSFIMNVIIIILIIGVNSHRKFIFIFILHYLFYGLNFHILSGILRSYFNYMSELLFILLGIKMIFNQLIINNLKFNWIIYLSFFFLKFGFEFFFLFMNHLNLNMTLVFYFFTNMISDVSSIFNCRNNEIFLRRNFIFLTQLKIEKKNLDNLIHNIGQGFISFSLNKNEIIKSNKFTQKLFNNLSKEIENIKNEINKNNSDKSLNKFNNENGIFDHLKASNFDIVKQNFENYNYFPNNLYKLNYGANNDLYMNINMNVIGVDKNQQENNNRSSNSNKNKSKNKNKFCCKKKNKDLIDEQKSLSKHNDVRKNSNISTTKLNNTSQNYLKEDVLQKDSLDLNERSNEFIMLEMFLLKLTEINDHFPNKLRERISNFLTEKNLLFISQIELKEKNIFANSVFHFIINQIKLYPQLFCDENFIYIGKIIMNNNLQELKQMKDFDKTNKNIFHKKEYELYLRIKNYDSMLNDSVVELIINDISIVIKRENKKIVDQCKNIYLSKSAHELKNPITSCQECLLEITDHLQNIYGENYNDLNFNNRTLTVQKSELSSNSSNEIDEVESNKKIITFNKQKENSLKMKDLSIKKINKTIEYLSLQLDIMNEFLDGIGIFSSNSHDNFNDNSKDRNAKKDFLNNKKKHANNLESEAFLNNNNKNNTNNNNTNFIKNPNSNSKRTICFDSKINLIKNPNVSTKIGVIENNLKNSYSTLLAFGGGNEERCCIISILSHQIKNFKNILLFEKKRFLKFSDDIIGSDNETDLCIYANYKLIKSMFFYIFYHCYKNITNGLISVALLRQESNCSEELVHQNTYVENLIINITAPKVLFNQNIIDLLYKNLEKQENLNLLNKPFDHSYKCESSEKLIETSTNKFNNINKDKGNNSNNNNDIIDNYSNNSLSGNDSFEFGINEFSSEDFNNYFYIYIVLIISKKLKLKIEIENTFKNTIFKLFFKIDKKNVNDNSFSNNQDNFYFSPQKTMKFASENKSKKKQEEASIKPAYQLSKFIMQIKHEKEIDNANNKYFNNKESDKYPISNKKMKDYELKVSTNSFRFNTLKGQNLPLNFSQQKFFLNTYSKTFELPYNIDNMKFADLSYNNNKEKLNYTNDNDYNNSYYYQNILLGKTFPSKNINEKINEQTNKSSENNNKFSKNLKLNNEPKFYKVITSGIKVLPASSAFETQSSRSENRLRIIPSRIDSKNSSPQSNRIGNNNHNFSTYSDNIYLETQRLSTLDMNFNYMQSFPKNLKEELSFVSGKTHSISLLGEKNSQRNIFKQKSNFHPSLENKNTLKLNKTIHHSRKISSGKLDGKNLNPQFKKNLQYKSDEKVKFGTTKDLKRIDDSNLDREKYLNIRKINKKLTSSIIMNKQNPIMKSIIVNKPKPSIILKVSSIIERRVLIIEDEEVIKNSVKRIFNKINEENLRRNNNIKYKVYDANNGLEAIGLIYNLFINNIIIDFVITDEMMPYVKGSEFVKFMKKLAKEGNFYDMVYISYTSYNSSEIIEKIKKSGVEYIMNKPTDYIRFKNLVDILEKKYK